MVNLLKTFGKGILYIIGFPFFLVALVLFGVVGIFLFIFQLIKSIIYFFTGQKFFPELPEDKELRLKKEAAFAMNNPQNSVQNEPRQEEQSIIYPFVQEEQIPQEEPPAIEDPNEYSPIEQACFNEPEPEEDYSLVDLVREEPPVEELAEETMEEPEETTLETSAPYEEEDEVLEEYVPKGTSFESDYEEDTNDSGVDIDYNVR